MFGRDQILEALARLAELLRERQAQGEICLLAPARARYLLEDILAERGP
jgi:hypothetical protein